MAGRRDLLEICTERGAKVQAADAYGRAALHYTTMNGFSECVSFLLTQNADIEARDHDGYSPLLYAVINGHATCVDILIKAGADIEPKHDADHIPLSLACYYGHTDIALILYQRGAKNLPNAESLYPLHLAARQGHVELCRMLARNRDDLDVPDKYNSWTPLFWAASDGHAECVRILIEAGCKVNLKDEYGKTALYYAAWEGQMECVQLLIDAGCEVEPVLDQSQASTTGTQVTRMEEDDEQEPEHELDAIPSLSLPPPILPFRIYGHSYLDRKYQVQISLHQPPIRLYDNTQISSLKLIITSKPDTGMIPHSVILPLVDDREIFSFQVDKLDDFLLEFDIFATFGSKVLGRGVALPETFSKADFKITEGHRTIPLLDSHLKVIGELAYDYSVVKPFRGVQLEIGGRIETYWKSTNIVMPSSSSASVASAPPAARLTPEPPLPQPSSDSIGTITAATTTATAPTSTTPTTHPVSMTSSTTLPSFITASSLAGDYVRVAVQLTKDYVPVVFANWLVPFEDLDLAVSDLTFEQYCQLGRKIMANAQNRGSNDPNQQICPMTGNSMIVQRLNSEPGFLSLEQVLRVSFMIWDASKESQRKRTKIHHRVI
ncbi:ankyrin repeat-containing domain protein [Zychaea mexicana]|uniref:ankyrin repeat-containing domain protein n=1 Tax=Zychaea mexicana TaxID=64656 RepID=UPI0022FDE0A7|nr:ankyrin repeat-containing domain protein [Zychaea mexicana]KAI9490772.1 ankyrin repeat-containing domain protein [Zychaea mexicana]